MKSRQFSLFVVSMVLSVGGIAAGCRNDESSTSSSNDTTTTTATTTTSTTSTTSTTTTSTTTSTTTTTGNGGGGGGSSGICDPQAGDDPCTMCVKTNCCDELETCVADAACQACLDCVTTMDPTGCVISGTCNLNDPIQGGVLTCGQQSCPKCTM